MNKVISLDIIARFTILTKSVDLLNRGARVMSVLASTAEMRHPEISTIKDLISGKRRVSGLQEIMTAAALSGDVLLVQASKRYPQLHIIGTHPGYIETELTKNTFSPLVNEIKAIIISLLPKSLRKTEEEAGDNHAQILASDNVLKKPGTFFNFLLEGRKVTSFAYDKEYGEWLWNFCSEFVASRS